MGFSFASNPNARRISGGKVMPPRFETGIAVMLQSCIAATKIAIHFFRRRQDTKSPPNRYKLSRFQTFRTLPNFVKRFDIDRECFTRFSMTAVTVSSKYQIAIPKEIRNILGIRSGSRLQFIPDDKGFRLVKEPEIDEIKGLLRGIPVVDSEIRDESDRELP
jgi:AbrB family looped-hinge helix DNA binding protein